MTREEQQAIKAENIIRLLASPFYRGGENFTVADIAHYLPTSHSNASLYLGDLAREGKLYSRISNGGATVYSKRSIELLRQPWRKISNESLGLVAPL